MTNPIIFKRTTTGAIQQWQQELDGNRYRTISGQVDGKLVTSEWTTCQGKNIGRSNETTPEAQAASEVESNYTKKLAQGGYNASLDGIDTPNFFKPMLAKDFNDYVPGLKDYAAKRVYSQPKLDGVRCIIDSAGMWSRQGKPIFGAPHIYASLKDAFDKNPDLILDGELYTDKLAQDFNKIISLVKKQKPNKDDLMQSAATIQYWFYDIPSVDAGFAGRNQAREEFNLTYVGLKYASILVPVDTKLIKDAEELDAFYGHYINAGCEGQIVRIDGTPYENKRTKSLLKRKEFITEEFTIRGITEGIGNRSGMAGYITYDLGNGKTFDSGIKGGFEFYRELLRDTQKYIGGQGTVRYFNRTPDGVPRFPVTLAVFEGKRDI